MSSCSSGEDDPHLLSCLHQADDRVPADGHPPTIGAESEHEGLRLGADPEAKAG
jgi:hypothetical protein